MSIRLALNWTGWGLQRIV